MRGGGWLRGSTGQTWRRRAARDCIRPVQPTGFRNQANSDVIASLASLTVTPSYTDRQVTTKFGGRGYGCMRALRLCGIAGLIGSSLLLAADWTLLGTFTSGSEFKDNWCALLSEMPRWRLLIGGLAGPVGAWFYVVGFWQLYLALQPAGG